MKSLIIFDCYQTLIYKPELAEIVRIFLKDYLNIEVPIQNITKAYKHIYDRHKFKHPRFESEIERQDFYIDYNKELLCIIGFETSEENIIELGKRLQKAKYACYEDTIPALDYFKNEGYSMGLLANWTKTLQEVVERLDLSKYFKFIDSSHELKVQKPDPIIFEQIKHKIDGNFESIYYIGNDYELDVAPARKIGFIPILVDREDNYPRNVDCVKVTNLISLKKVIK